MNKSIVEQLKDLREHLYSMSINVEIYEGKEKELVHDLEESAETINGILFDLVGDW